VPTPARWRARQASPTSIGLVGEKTALVAVDVAVAFPPQQHVVPRHVQLVAHRRERGDPDAEPGQLIHHGEAQAVGLHDQAGDAVPRLTGGERGVKADAGHGHAEAVRADQPHAVPAAHREQIGAGGDLQPGCDYHQGPHPALAALFRRVQDRRGGTAITARSTGSGRCCRGTTPRAWP
jgi:hypothetical protein